jgi:hypothetical protein
MDLARQPAGATVAAGAAMTAGADPWLSVLLPVYNVGAALDDCLRSLLEQHLPGIEVVLVDDASTGDDAARLAQWQRCHPQVVRLIAHETNRGVSAARNTLLDAARGAWVWFVDPDDLVEPGALAALKATLDRDAPDMVLCDFRTFTQVHGANGSIETRRPHVSTFQGPADEPGTDVDALIEGLFRCGQLHPWTKVVRRAAWPASLRFPEGRVFEDLHVFPRLALAMRSFVHVPEVWIAYRQREGSLLASLDERKLEDWSLALAGYADAMHAALPAPRPNTAFEVAHFCARTLLRVVRRQRDLPQASDTPRRLRDYADRWRASSPLDADALASAYLARGRLGRWAQWRWNWRRIGG